MEEELTANSSIFRELDAGFIGFNGGDLTYVWSTVDMVVQWSWELAIPIPIPGSEIKYEFETVGYDIAFGIRFEPADPKSPTKFVKPVERAASHESAAVGTCIIPEKGTAKLVWDNSFSWFTPKTLSYSVTMTLPEHRVAEAARTTRAQSALAATKEDVIRATSRLQRTHQTVAQLHREIPVLQKQLDALQNELQTKRKSLEVATQEAHQLESRIFEDKSRTLGLCIRFLGAGPLRNVFEYAEKPAVASVCKYWRAVLQPAKVNESPSHLNLSANATVVH